MDYERKPYVSKSIVDISQNEQYRVSFNSENNVFDLFIITKNKKEIIIEVCVRYDVVEKINKDNIHLFNALGRSKEYIFIFEILKYTTNFSKKEISDLLRNTKYEGTCSFVPNQHKSSKFIFTIPNDRLDTS